MFDSTKTKKKGSGGYSKVKERIDCRIILEKSEVLKSTKKKSEIAAEPSWN